MAGGGEDFRAIRREREHPQGLGATRDGEMQQIADVFGRARKSRHLHALCRASCARAWAPPAS